MRHAAPCSRWPLAFMPALMLTGCAADNDRLTLGDGRGNDITLTSIEPDAPLEPAPGPSITTTDRGHWPEILAPVPMDRPHDTGLTVSTRRASNARHNGRFPTPPEAILPRTLEPACSGPETWQRAAEPAR